MGMTIYSKFGSLKDRINALSKPLHDEEIVGEEFLLETSDNASVLENGWLDSDEEILQKAKMGSAFRRITKQNE